MRPPDPRRGRIDGRRLSQGGDGLAHMLFHGRLGNPQPVGDDTLRHAFDPPPVEDQTRPFGQGGDRRLHPRQGLVAQEMVLRRGLFRRLPEHVQGFRAETCAHRQLLPVIGQQARSRMKGEGAQVLRFGGAVRPLSKLEPEVLNQILRLSEVAETARKKADQIRTKPGPGVCRRGRGELFGSRHLTSVSAWRDLES